MIIVSYFIYITPAYLRQSEYRCRIICTKLAHNRSPSSAVAEKHSSVAVIMAAESKPQQPLSKNTPKKQQTNGSRWFNNR
jgi:hypothetical protein